MSAKNCVEDPLAQEVEWSTQPLYSKHYTHTPVHVCTYVYVHIQQCGGSDVV